MTEQQKGSLWNALGSVMFAATTVIILVAISQTTEVETVGDFGIALTIAQQLYIVGALGTTYFLMTDYKKQFRYAEYLWVKVIACLTMFLVCGALVLGGMYQEQKALFTMLLTGFFLINAVGDLYQGIFFRENRLDLYGQALFFRMAGSVVVFVIVDLLLGDVLIALLALLIANCILTWILGIHRAKPWSGTQRSPDWKAIRHLLLQCLPLFVSDFLALLVVNAPRYGIDVFLDAAAQGYFTMIFLPVFVVNLLSQFIFRPSLQHYAKLLEDRNLKAFWTKALKQVAIITGATLLLVVALWFLGVPVLSWLYAIDLKPVQTEMLVVALGAGFLAMCNLAYYVLVILRKQTLVLVTYGVGAFGAALSCVLLINWIGLIGACMAFIIIHLLMLILYLAFVQVSLRKI